MAKTSFKSVDDYIASQPEGIRAALQGMRDAIRQTVPGADERIAYQMPAYKLHGRPLLYFAAWKAHYALYPATGPLLAAFAEELAAYKVRKGTIHLPLNGVLPLKLISRIAAFRAQELTGRAADTSGRSKRH